MFDFRTVIVFFLLLSLVGCKDRKQDGSINTTVVNGGQVITCDLSKVSSKEELLLSNLVEDLEIIHLDNDDEAFFKPWVTTVTENYIGIRQHGNAPFKLFDRKGNFLHNIGKGGNGPGEYAIALYDEIIDEKNNRIYFSSFMGDKILVYGLDGNHIKDLKLPFKLQKPKIQLTNDGNLMIAHMPFPDDQFFAFQMDLDGNILKGIAPREDMLVMGFDSELFSYRNSSVFDVYHTELDTLYHIDMNRLEIIPVLTSTEREDGWLCLYTELPDRYLLNIFNYKTKECKMINTTKGSEKSSQVKLLNDYLGNLEMDFNFNKGYFIQNLEPAILIDKITNLLFSSTALTNENTEKLNSLLNILDENQNNVLLIGKLKQVN